MYCSKTYRQQGDILLAVCDEEVLSKRFQNGEVNFYVDPSFYHGEKVSEETLLDLFKEANIINLAGQRCIDLAIREGFVDPENILDLGKCRHAQVLRL